MTIKDRTCTAVVLIVLATMTIAQSSCVMRKLKAQLQEVRRIVWYTGRAALEVPGKAPVIVVLYRTTGPAEQRVVTFDIVPGDNDFNLIALPGEYRVLAFEDANRNFIYDAGERIGYLASTPADAHADPDARNDFIVPAADQAAPGFPIDLSTSAMNSSVQQRLTRIGAQAVLDDPRFSAENGSNGLWKPFDFLKDPGPGLFFLQPYDPKRTPVLFVHGMSGTPLDFQYLIRNFDWERFQPWVFQYPTGLSLNFTAWYLDEALEELEARHKFSEVVIVAHSMGGLVSRAFINRRTMEGRPPLVRQFVTISTPWQGHTGARIGVKMAPVVAPSWYDMDPKSPFLRELQKVPLPPGVRHSLLFSYRGGIFSMFGADDGSTSVAGQLAYGVQDRAALVYGFNENHDTVLTNPQIVTVLDRILKQTP